jgi:predicted lactoylglutathione lyase
LGPSTMQNGGARILASFEPCVLTDGSVILNLPLCRYHLVETFFKTFTKKEISDTSKNTEVIVALSAEGREKVDQMINNAIGAGGRESREPQDHGWMYGRSFEDIDGHLWEVIFMDESALKNDGKPS